MKRHLAATRSLKWVCVALALGACAPLYSNHGYIPPPEDLEQIVVGRDTRASVAETLGPSATGSVVNDNGFYYVRSRVRTFGMFAPEVIERQVLAVSFGANGVVSNVERFGLEDGQVVPLARRVTDTNVDNQGFIRQLLGNIGQIGPGT